MSACDRRQKGHSSQGGSHGPDSDLSEPHSDKFTVAPCEYMGLSKYFEEQATQIKGNMLKVVPWLVAVATVLIGYGIDKADLLGSPQPQQASAASVFCGVALCILIMACIVAYYFVAHMQRNWARSDYACKQLLNWRHGTSCKQEFHPYTDVLENGKAKFWEILKGSLWLIVPILLVGAASAFLVARATAAVMPEQSDGESPRMAQLNLMRDSISSELSGRLATGSAVDPNEKAILTRRVAVLFAGNNCLIVNPAPDDPNSADRVEIDRDVIKAILWCRDK